MTPMRRGFAVCTALLVVTLGGCGLTAGSADFVQGEEALKDGETTVAASYFAAADKSSNHDPTMLNEIASAYGKAGKTNEMLDWLQRVVKADPSIANRERAAFTETQSGRLDEGCRELSALFPVFSSDPRLTNDYAYICMVESGKELDRAISLLQTSVDRTHRDGTVVDSLGWAYVQRYRQGRRLEDLLKGTGLLEESAITVPIDDIRGHLTAAYSLMDRPAVVNRSLAGHWVIEDSLSAAWIVGHRRSIQRADFALVTSLLEDAVEQRPQDAPARQHLSEAYQLAGRSHEALVERLKAIALDPRLGSRAAGLTPMRGTS